VVVHAELRRRIGYGNGIHERCTVRSQLAFRFLRIFGEKELGDDELENGVAEEFKPFSVLSPRLPVLVEL
jgi:hypothetical protein